LSELTADLADSIRAAACSRPVRPNADELREPGTALRIGLPTTTEQVLAIGASTGGTDAIRYVLTRLPPLTPGTVIVQHMPAYVTAAFAERLSGLCAMEVREARSGDAVQPGVALIAPGGRHMRLRRGPGGYRIDITTDPPVCRQRPSVDVLFHSVAECAGRNATGVILTGMGADGAEGLLAMKQAGAHTLAQDEASCVVFGMPKEAIRLGATEHVVPLKRMPERILQTFAGKRTHAVAGSQP
jgi:two-component system chemotaxis response regulator CheB